MKKMGAKKKRETCLERYGVEYPLQSKEIKAKSEATTLERYGTTSLFSLPEVQEQIRESGSENMV